MSDPTEPKPTPLVERCKVPPEGWYCSRTPGHDGPCAARREPLRVTEADFERASKEVARLQRELAVTNADHVALWLEDNLPDASPAWLACRIVEAHEKAEARSAALIARLTEQVAGLEEALKPFAEAWDEAQEWAEFEGEDRRSIYLANTMSLDDYEFARTTLGEQP